MTLTVVDDVTELVQTEVIDDIVGHYQFDEVHFLPFARFKDMRSAPSNVASFPRAVKDAHSDLATEATALTPVAFETTQVSITMGRVGIARDPSETVLEDTVLGRARYLTEMIMDTARLLGEAAEEDYAAEFANASNSVSDPNNDLEIIDLVVAVGKQRAAKVRGVHVFCLDDEQLSNFEDAVAAAAITTWAAFYTPNMDGTAFGGYFMGAPMFSSGLNPTAHTGGSVVGCLYAQGQAAPRYGAFGYAVKRQPTTKFDEQILADSLTMATITRYGVGTVAANFATQIVTDAPA